MTPHHLKEVIGKTKAPVLRKCVFTAVHGSLISLENLSHLLEQKTEHEKEIMNMLGFNVFILASFLEMFQDSKIPQVQEMGKNITAMIKRFEEAATQKEVEA